MMTEPHSPSADEVACAIIAAARQTGENPTLIFNAVDGAKVRLRCRYLAARVLASQFPSSSRSMAGRVVGFDKAVAQSLLAPSQQPKNFDRRQLESARKECGRLIERHCRVRAQAEPIERPAVSRSPQPKQKTLIDVTEDVIREELHRPYVPQHGRGEFNKLSPSKTVLRQMLADAVRNTGGKPIK